MMDIFEINVKAIEGKKLTQQERVFRDLFYAGDDGVCGTEWLADYIPRYSVHIHVLRSKHNYTIVNERCDDPAHNHQSKQTRFVLQLAPPLPFVSDGPAFVENPEAIGDPDQTPIVNLNW